MELFVEEGLMWDKLASAELEEDATAWPRQVLTELFRVLPEISEYTPDVKVLKLNEEQGYAMGVVVVSNQTNSALASQKQVGAPAPKALVPFIVKSGRLCPLDILMSAPGKMYPLTPERLREVLYRPETFELLSDDWNDSSLWQLFQPPGRDFGTGGNVNSQLGAGASGGVQYMMGPGMKSASLEDAPMLQAISDSVLEPDLMRFAHRITSNEKLAKTAGRNPAARGLFEAVGHFSPVSEKTASSFEELVTHVHEADVLQATYDPGRGHYIVKLASRNTGAARVYECDRRAMLNFAGAKFAAEVDRHQAVTLAERDPNTVVVVGSNGQRPSVIESTGCYTVFNAITGAQLEAWVITGLVDCEGNRLPIALAANDMGAVLQDQIAGIGDYASKSELPHDPPKGSGCFTFGEGGQCIATVPVTVKGSITDASSTRYPVVDLNGEKFTIVLQRGIKAVVAFPERKELVMPYTSSFISLAQALPPLVQRGTDSAKTASALLEGKVLVRTSPADPENVTLSFQNLPKLAALFPKEALDHDAAIFALCRAGLSSTGARDALKTAALTGTCHIRTHDIAGVPEIDKKKVASHIREIHAIRRDLLKEAATLPEATTVDAVLSLDFINSENVRTFISMIPYLEKALNRICELIFASRLGVNEIPEAAAARAARGLDDAIRGLKALALRQISELP